MIAYPIYPAECTPSKREPSAAGCVMGGEHFLCFWGHDAGWFWKDVEGRVTLDENEHLRYHRLCNYLKENFGTRHDFVEPPTNPYWFSLAWGDSYHFREPIWQHDVAVLFCMAFPGKMFCYFERCYDVERYVGVRCTLEIWYDPPHVSPVYDKVPHFITLPNTFEGEPICKLQPFYRQVFCEQVPFTIAGCLERFPTVPCKVRILIDVFGRDVANLISSYLYVIVMVK